MGFIALSKTPHITPAKKGDKSVLGVHNDTRMHSLPRTVDVCKDDYTCWKCDEHFLIPVRGKMHMEVHIETGA